MRRLAEASIEALPDAMRTVYVLRAIAGMTDEEVAQALALPAAGVRASFRRAQRQLRDAVACELDGGLEHVFSFAGARCDRIVAGVLRRLEEFADRQFLIGSPLTPDRSPPHVLF